jgi:hypothetical protein
LRLFTSRDDPAGREEQFERLYVLLLDASPKSVSINTFRVGDPGKPISISEALDDLLLIVAQRSADLYEFDNGGLRRAT